MNLMFYVIVAFALFVIGGATVLTRRNGVVALLGVEIMLNACNLAFVTFSRMWGNLEGQVFAFFVMVVAAAEVVVGLAIVVSIYRARGTTSLDSMNLLKN